MMHITITSLPIYLYADKSYLIDVDRTPWDSTDTPQIQNPRKYTDWRRLMHCVDKSLNVGGRQRRTCRTFGVLDDLARAHGHTSCV